MQSKEDTASTIVSTSGRAHLTANTTHMMHTYDTITNHVYMCMGDTRNSCIVFGGPRTLGDVFLDDSTQVRWSPKM